MKLDHLVVTCADLGRGAVRLEEALGVPTQAGGRHALMGTWNRLLSLGPDEYLEVIAPDPEAGPPGRPRWFALDRRDGPTLSNWMARTDDLDADLARMPVGIGMPTEMRRGDLSWRVAIPEDGELPYAGACPGLLQWHGAHPAPALDDVGCRLVSLRVQTPDAGTLSAALSLDDSRVTIAEGEFWIEAVIDTPDGEMRLS